MRRDGLEYRMANFPRSLPERASLYANAIHEIRMRLRMVEDLRRTELPQLFVYESCRLQLRMTCECLAMACLAAQGDYETHRALREGYAVPAIFKVLAEAHPNFFPRPANLRETLDGWLFNANASRPLAITRDQVEALWNRSGSDLHRASAKRYVARTNAVDFDAVRRGTDSFWWLLANHAVELTASPGDSVVTVLHVLIDTATDAMALHFIHANCDSKTVTIEEFFVDAPPAS